jgi:hypothetical protein
MISNQIPSLLDFSYISWPIARSSEAIRASDSPETTPYQTSVRKMMLPKTSPTLLQPMGIYVGELQKRWQFPSDHLPIAMTFETFHFASWNVLDAEYMSWVTEKNSQGISHSMIADEHRFINNSCLTIRDQHIVDLILKMISHPTHSRSLLSLQECSEPFLKELRSRLPNHSEIISNNGNAILIDRSCFDLIEAKEVFGVFAGEPFRTLQDISIRRIDNGQPLRLVNAHLPGDPAKPGRFEFARYLADTFDPNLTTIAMGDMNFNELEIADAMKEAFLNRSPFSLYSPYCTNISPHALTSKAIDHFLVYSPNQSPVSLNAPNQIMPGLDSMVSLLHGSNQHFEKHPKPKASCCDFKFSINKDNPTTINHKR